MQAAGSGDLALLWSDLRETRGGDLRLQWLDGGDEVRAAEGGDLDLQWAEEGDDLRAAGEVARWKKPRKKLNKLCVGVWYANVPDFKR